MAKAKAKRKPVSKKRVAKKNASKKTTRKAPKKNAAKKTPKKKKLSKQAAAPKRGKMAGTPSQKRAKNFLERLRDNSMVDYFTRLRIMNPAAELNRQLNEPRREGGFVRLAHANEEFTAPVLSKGKAAIARAADKKSLLPVEPTFEKTNVDDESSQNAQKKKP